MDINIIKDFGFPVALCIALLYGIRHMAQELTASYKDRINTLEQIVKEMQMQMTADQLEIRRRADGHAHDLKSVVERYAKVVSDHDAWAKQSFSILSRLIDAWQTRPCMLAGDGPPPAPPPQPVSPPPYKRVPSSDDIPAPPAVRLTGESSRIAKAIR